MRNQRGQILVEAVLIAVLAAGLMSLIVSGLKKGEFIQKLTIQPWSSLQGMIECGVWQPCGVQSPASGLHPSSPDRVLSLDPASQ